jgi:hypothetical protein
MTSEPTRGWLARPFSPPAQLLPTRTQQLLVSSHDGSLQGQQPGRRAVEAASGKPRHGLALAKHAILVLGKYILALQIIIAGFVMHFQNQEFAVFAFTEMVKQLEPPAGSDAPIIAACFV